jgi:hypothetical protein
MKLGAITRRRVSRSVLRTVLSLALVWTAGSTVPAIADECIQPSDGGCPVELNQAVTAVLANASDVHAWRVVIGQVVPLHIVLTDLLADYDLHVYGSDGTLLGESTNEGTQDDIVDLPAAAAGRYIIYVNSPRGAVSTTSYTLAATASGGGAVAPSQGAPTAGVPVPGVVLLADTLDDPSVGWLPTTSTDPAMFRGYVDGEYRIAKLNQTPRDWTVAFAPGTYTNVAINVDARTVVAGDFTEAAIDCRSEAPSALYEVRVRPESRTVGLIRLDPGVDRAVVVVLVPDFPASTIIRGQPIHLELVCVGTTISASVNGQNVGPIEDSTYLQGRIGIKAGGATNVPADVRFKNLVVTQR